MTSMKRSARAVQAAIEAAGLDCQVRELPSSSRTAEQAAESIGCTVAQIAKSIAFRAAESGRPVLVITSGPNRIHQPAVARVIGEPLERATPAFVREKTGFAIGGVPPCGHAEPPVALVDRDLLELPELWAAAGTPNAVARLDPDQILQLTFGQVIDVKA